MTRNYHISAFNRSINFYTGFTRFFGSVALRTSSGFGWVANTEEYSIGYVFFQRLRSTLIDKWSRKNVFTLSSWSLKNIVLQSVCCQLEATSEYDMYLDNCYQSVVSSREVEVWCQNTESNRCLSQEKQRKKLKKIVLCSGGDIGLHSELHNLYTLRKKGAETAPLGCYLAVHNLAALVVLFLVPHQQRSTVFTQKRFENSTLTLKGAKKVPLYL